MIIEKFASTGSGYRESTSFSDVNETIIRKGKLDILTLGDDLFGIYNKSGSSSKKRKRDINIYGCDFSVSVVWKKNVVSFSSRAATAANESFLGKSI